MKDRINFGIIGCGGISRTHLWAMEQSGQTRLKAVCDIKPERMEHLEDEYPHARPLFFQDYKQLLNSPEVDAVAVCLPHHLHAPVLIDALEANKHVLCEKPFGITVSQIREAGKKAEEAAARGVKCGGISQHRFSLLIRETASVLRENLLGNIISVSVSFRCSRPDSYYALDAWRGLWQEAGGGVVINQAFHTLDLAFFLFGTPRDVSARIGRRYLTSIEVEDEAEGFFGYDPGIIGSGRMEFHCRNDLEVRWEPIVEIEGTEGTLSLRGSVSFETSREEIRNRLQPHARPLGEKKKSPGKACYGDLHGSNYNNFIDFLRGDIPEPLITPGNFGAVTEAMLGIYNSHFTGEPCTLPLDSWSEPVPFSVSGDRGRTNRR